MKNIDTKYVDEVINNLKIINHYVIVEIQSRNNQTWEEYKNTLNKKGSFSDYLKNIIKEYLYE